MGGEPLSLPRKLAAQPVLMRQHKVADVRLGGIQRRPHHHLRLPRHLQRHSAPAGAEHSVLYHGSTHVKRGPV